MATRVRATPRPADATEDSLEDLLTPPEEARALFDAEARRIMGMPGPEFLRRWDAGEFDIDGPDHAKLVHLYFLMPFGRA